MSVFRAFNPEFPISNLEYKYIYFTESFKDSIRRRGIVQHPFTGRIMNCGDGYSRHAGSDVFADSISAICGISQMAFIEKTLDIRIVVHGSHTGLPAALLASISVGILG